MWNVTKKTYDEGVGTRICVDPWLLQPGEEKKKKLSWAGCWFSREEGNTCDIGPAHLEGKFTPVPTRATWSAEAPQLKPRGKEHPTIMEMYYFILDALPGVDRQDSHHRLYFPDTTRKSTPPPFLTCCCHTLEIRSYRKSPTMKSRGQTCRE